MQRIIPEVGAAGPRVFHERGIVKGANGVLVCDARGDDFATAGISSHEMGFDQAGDNFQIGVDEASIQPHRGASTGFSNGDVVFRVFGVVVDHLKGLDDGRIADQFFEFLAQIGTVQSGRDEDGDAFAGEASCEEAVQERSEQKPVGYGTGDVANDDAGGAGLPRQLGQRRSRYGGCECGDDGCRWIGQQRHGRLFNDLD